MGESGDNKEKRIPPYALIDLWDVPIRCSRCAFAHFIGGGKVVCMVYECVRSEAYKRRMEAERTDRDVQDNSSGGDTDAVHGYGGGADGVRIIDLQQDEG